MPPVPRKLGEGAWAPSGVPRPARRPKGGPRPAGRHAHGHDEQVPADPAAAVRIPVREVMSAPVVVARPDETLQAVTRRMLRHDIGCVVVKDAGRVVGILTERDVLREATRGCRLSERHVEDLMARALVVGSEEDDLSTAVRTMVEHNVKRLPVLRRGRLVGILTFTDFARVEPRLAQTFREALEDASAQARRKFEGRLPSRAPEWTFI